MEKSQRMHQIYGYLVCLVAVITVLICASTLVYAILDLGDPIHAGFTPAGMTEVLKPKIGIIQKEIQYESSWRRKEALIAFHVKK